MHVAADLPRHFLQPAEQAVGLVLQYAGRGADAQQHGVEQGETLRIGVADDASGQIEEGPRDGEGRAVIRSRHGFFGEQVIRRVADLPRNVRRGYPRERESARGGPPAVKILLMRKRDGAHQLS